MKRSFLAAATIAGLAAASSTTSSAVQAKEPCAVPKSWGKLVAVSARGNTTDLIFEAEDGTIRAVWPTCKPGEAQWEIERN